MSSDPIEVLRSLPQKWRGLANNAMRRSGTWSGNDMADRIGYMADELDAALASLSAPKPESAEAVAWAYRSEDPYNAGEWTITSIGAERPCRREVRPLVYGDTAPPRPEASGDKWHEAVVNACSRIEGSYYADDPEKTLRAIEQWWHDLGSETMEDALLGKAAQEKVGIAPRQASAPVGVEGDAVAKVVTDMRKQAAELEGSGGCEDAWAHHQKKFADRLDALAQQPVAPSAPGCGSCADGCKDRGSCRVRDESPPSAPVGVEGLLREWSDAYRAFRGAFDTPLSRKRQGDEYAEDARSRLAAIDEKMRALAQHPSVAPVGVEGLPGEIRNLASEFTDEGGATEVMLEWADRLERVLAQQPAACGTCREVIRPDALTGTTCKCAQQPAAVDAWRAAFVAARAMHYRTGGMAIEQARIHAETDAARMAALAAGQQQGGES